MAGFLGNAVARYVVQGKVKAFTATWNAARVGTTNLAGRQWIDIQVRGSTALALAYANRNIDGTFTTPTNSAHNCKIIPRNTIYSEPLSDDVTLYVRAVNKVASNAGGCVVVVAEYM